MGTVPLHQYCFTSNVSTFHLSTMKQVLFAVVGFALFQVIAGLLAATDCTTRMGSSHMKTTAQSSSFVSAIILSLSTVQVVPYSVPASCSAIGPRMFPSVIQFL